jgi:DNA-binding GntR family transcriptional regulator
MGGCQRDHVVNRELPIPLHEQVAAILREQIRSGKLTARVPSILTIAQEYGVSHRTSDHALRTLKDEGLIIPVRGLGYYVRKDDASPA